MGIKNYAKKNFYNFNTWLGVDYLAGLTQNLGNYAKSLTKYSIKEKKDNFEDVCEDFNLDEEKLQLQKRQFLFVAWFSCLCALAVAFYTVTLLLKVMYLSSLLGFAIVILCLSQAFRYSFWHYQLKERRLGCSLKEWLYSLFRGDQ